MPATWREEAESRIARHRIVGATLRPTLGDHPLPAGTEVAIEQTRSAFRFGTCIALGQGAGDEPYRDYLAGGHFDVVTSENAMKWYAIEPERGSISFAAADRELAFAEGLGCAMRGHCLLWAKEKFVKPWARDLSAGDLSAALDAHLDRTVTRYRGRLLCWDVLNELLDGRFFQERLGEGIAARIFRRAHDLDPDTRLFVNEYGILCTDAKLARYLDLISDLRAAGAPVGGIGVQEHAAERFTPDLATAEAERDLPERQGRGPLVPAEVWGRLDRLAETGLPIHITEVSVVTRDEARRAAALEMFLTTAYAHPAVEAFVLWGFWAGRHWLGDPAALVDRAWLPTAAGRVWDDLVLGRWRTRLTARVSGDGTVRFAGHRGRYRCRALLAGGTVGADFALDGSQTIPAALTRMDPP